MQYSIRPEVGHTLDTDRHRMAMIIRQNDTNGRPERVARSTSGLSQTVSRLFGSEMLFLAEYFVNASLVHFKNRGNLVLVESESV